LKNLGLNIRRAKISSKEKSKDGVQNVFYLTESSTSEKIVKSARLEEIRMTSKQFGFIERMVLSGWSI
jgi:hypothetical protein